MPKNQNGFTTVELCVVIIIFGMVMSGVMLAFKTYNQQQIKIHNKQSFNTSMTALLSFQGNRGIYPCPADPGLARNAINYGREVRAGGVCSAGGNIIRATIAGLDRDGDGFDDTVLIGAVPFATLLDPDGNPLTNDGIRDVPLKDSLTYDGWGRKLTYVVTERLTSLATYNDFFGVIDVVDENDRSLVDPPRSGHVLLVSHGPNGRGGYTNAGVLTEACPGALPIAILPEIATPVNETENCNGNGKFLSGLQNDRASSFNDDIVKFMINETTGLWAYVGGSPDHVQNTNAGNVGIGTKAPSERLEIDGKLRANEVRADEFCEDPGNINCLPPAVIGGNLAQMQCPPGQIATAIERNSIYDPGNGINHCQPAFTAPPPITACAPGCYASGFSRDASGNTHLLCRKSSDQTVCP